MGTSSAFASREQREIRNGETKFLGSTTRRFAAIAGLSAVLTLSVTACGGGSDSDDSAVESQTSSDLFGADDAGGAADLPESEASGTTIAGQTTTTDPTATTMVGDADDEGGTNSTVSGGARNGTAADAGDTKTSTANSTADSVAAQQPGATAGTQPPAASTAPPASTAGTEAPTPDNGNDMTEAEVRAEMISELTAAGIDQATSECVADEILSRLSLSQMAAWGTEGLSRDDMPPELVDALQYATFNCIT